ncbi:hypothetical protein [Sorangium cellulosum]|uniref:hypothetical protein n=1 Tax=Sorangium cellulosum TaxID=56 RepID=UPI0005D1DAE5|nr:hypothetical protein [Sorangium cellulosum]
MREEREGVVAVPAGETACLIVVTADLAHRPLSKRSSIDQRPSTGRITSIEQACLLRGPLDERLNGLGGGFAATVFPAWASGSRYAKAPPVGSRAG